jgi:hypothetical protein
MLQITSDFNTQGTELTEWIREVQSPSTVTEIVQFVADEIASIDAVYLRIVGHTVRKLITVDGRVGGALESVRPAGGEIDVEWDVVSDVLIWIGQTLRDRSPVVSGEYRDSHTLFADGDEVSVGDVIPPASSYTFINTTPYARKIEIGKTESGRDFVIQVPNRIYERTGQDAQARFGNIAKITTGFEAAPSGSALALDQKSRSFGARGRRVSPRQRPDRVAGSAVTVPAIYIEIG